MQKPRARELGLPFPGNTGTDNAITDVPGVAVGFSTITDADNAIRTGVTAIVPNGGSNEPRVFRAGHAVLNGNGEMTGTHWIKDAGYCHGPICITNTHSLGIAHHAAIKWMLARHADAYRDHHLWALPVIAETYDGVLNDINAQAVTEAHVLDALNSAAPGPVAEGSSGGGNGMICYGFKGGTGTASRQLQLGSEQYTVGTLVQANHGIRPWLNILGVKVGEQLADYDLFDGTQPARESGSIISIIATDAPLSSISLQHLARRAALGVGRGGSPGGNNSGDLFLAFSVADSRPLPAFDTDIQHITQLNSQLLDPLYLATVEAVEESVVNALVAGVSVPTVKPAGHLCHALPTDELMRIMSTAVSG